MYSQEKPPIDFQKYNPRFERTKSAADFSPPRSDMIYERRTAWPAATEDKLKNQMSFGREKYAREARFS